MPDCSTTLRLRFLPSLKIETVLLALEQAPVLRSSTSSGDFKEHLHLQGLHRLQPLPLPPSGFVFSPSGGSLEIRAFLEWSRSATSLWRQGKPLRLILVTSPSAKRAHQESPCGLGTLIFISCHSSVESRLSLRARHLVVTSLRSRPTGWSKC